jgi:hypothetical protein
MKKILLTLVGVVGLTMGTSIAETVYSVNDFPQGTPTAPITRTGAEIFGTLTVTNPYRVYSPSNIVYTLTRETRIGDYHGLIYQGSDGTIVMMDANVTPDVLPSLPDYGHDETTGSWGSLDPNAKHSIVLYAGTAENGGGGGVRFYSTNQSTVSDHLLIDYDSFIFSDGATSISLDGLFPTLGGGGAFVEQAQELNVGLEFIDGQWSVKE